MKKQLKSARPKVIDLFSGVGGLSLGAARAGFDVCGSVEFNPHALVAHSVNFPKATHFLADISTLSGKGLKTLFRLADDELFGIIGGPPCQGFSVMGQHKEKDPRNLLYVQFFRLVSQALPQFFMAENVPGILKKSSSRILSLALSHVKKSFDIVGPFKVVANEYGAPTSRSRVFVVGYRKGGQVSRLTVEKFIAAKCKERINVQTALYGLPEIISPAWQDDAKSWRKVSWNGGGYFFDRLKGVIPYGVGDPVAIKKLRKEKKVSGFLGTYHSKAIENRYSKLLPGGVDKISKSRRLDPVGYCPTLRAGTGPERGSFQAVRPIHPKLPRVITPREGARLQGFPDWYQFSATKWHSFQQIGNSVSPLLAERLLKVVSQSIKPSA